MGDSLIAHYTSKRDLAHKRIGDAVAVARKCKTDRTYLYRLETWGSRLNSYMETFDDAHTKLMCLLTESNAEQELISKQTAYQEEADSMFFEVLEAMRTLLPKATPEGSNGSNGGEKPHSNSKLPPMKLPLFSGQLKDFPGFIDLYNTLVHRRTDLTNVEKFQYLITSLSGEPINIIRAFSISEANYKSAYDALVDRYSNKRYLAFVCWEQIMNLKPMTVGSAQSLRRLLDTYSENLSMLDSLGLPTNNWDFILFHSLLTKLDKASREAFELNCKTSDFPTFQELKTFLKSRCEALERSSLSTNINQTTINNQTNQTFKNIQRSSQQGKSSPTMLLAQTTQSFLPPCILCKNKHALHTCSSFLNKTPRARSDFVKQNKLCANCLRGNHATSACMSAFRCKACGQPHNSLLHFPSNHQQSNSPNQIHENQRPPVDDIITPKTSLSSSSPSTKSTFVMLATAMVEVKDGFGSHQKVRVLIDPCSQSQIITKSCVQRLGLTRYGAATPMSGLGEVLTLSSGKVFLEVRPVGEPEPSFTVEAEVMDKICSNMPNHPVNRDVLKHISNLKLADERYYESRPIDILLGGEVFPKILLNNKIEGGNQAATAIETIFGYVLMGRTASLNETSPIPLSVNHVSMDANLDVAVQKLWEIDNISPVKESLSIEDAQCEQIYQSTTTRDTEGRYVVQLPFRDQSLPEFEDSYSIALRRFYQLEKRLIKNFDFHQEYNDQVLDYLASGQMELVPPEECQSPSAYYIPHHAVIKNGKVSRVVYDAATKDKKGISLNDTLLTGPKLQAEITDILWLFRLHEIVFTADIRQMYRRIIISEQHRDYQRIIFRTSPEEPLQEYRLNRVTFGVSSAPYLAIRTMNQLAQDEQESFPIAADILRKNLYVDDVVTGCNSIDEALECQRQLIGIMASGGFELRKWSSNHEAVLQIIPESHRAVPEVTFDSDSSFVKVLGLAWNSHEDFFNYQVNQIKRECTKRTMLSELARIYDPVGLLTPLTFSAKHLIQRLWLLGTSWDEKVPDDINQLWTKYTEQLPNLSQLRIPRRITRNGAVTYQLHGFSDASEAGYAGAVYLRSTDEQNQHQVALIGARSRVAPTKRRTLPRLELCGAALLADLMHHIINLYSKFINIESVWAWSDSMIVLAWIKSNSTDYKAFVGNRISSIQRKLPGAQWKYVPGKQNPADCASRGLTPDELINHDLWWTGPEWLSHDHHQWPIEPKQRKTFQNDPEVSIEKRACVLTNTLPVEEHPFDRLINKYSSLRKIQRVVAYCKRFIQCLRKNKRSDHFTEFELHEALMILVRHVQQSSFKEEIHRLSSGQALPKSIKSLNPYLDDQGVFRVGGRLARSDLSFEAKHPALLPRKHRLTQLIIQCVHNENLHPGLQTLHYLLLQNFWILSPRRVIRQVISNCYRCFRVKPTPYQPEMADLPRSRVTQIKAFQSVGCDYAGPFNVTFKRQRGARTTKAYLCLFVCFATKAVHLELASDMSSQAFLGALQRFIGRRGRCNTIHCDCGTNFKGAESQLASIMQSACEAERIEFRFNPPGAPHFGGLWEAGVKSVKTHLYRVIGAQILTYEELNTLFVKVEAILNSRPLCPLSSDPNDLSVLTPGHFLTLAPLTTVPAPDYTNIQLNRLVRWQLLQRLHQDFWSRWHREYLANLSQRLKWTKSLGDVEINQPVIIKDECTHPLRWRFGKIIQLYYGRDGVPRSATIKTSQGQLNRPLVKLCPIPPGI